VLINPTDPGFTLKHLEAVVDGDLLVMKMKNEEWKPPSALLPACLDDSYKLEKRAMI